MRKLLSCSLLAAVAVASVVILSRDTTSEAADKNAKGQLLSHDVYFTLKDNSAAAKQKLVSACQKYLSKHPGEVFFAAGVRTEELKREVNDQDFDVALHIVFQDMASHEKYQDAPRHKQFIEENRDNWKKVRVFDSWVSR